MNVTYLINDVFLALEVICGYKVVSQLARHANNYHLC